MTLRSRLPQPIGRLLDRLAPRQRVYAYLGPDMALAQLHDGHFIYVDPADEGMSAQIIARGYWEQWIEAVVRRLTRPGDRVIDVGANIGYYTLILAGIVGPKGHVRAFDANPDIASRLARSLRFNGYDAYAKVEAVAVGDRSQEIPFFVSRKDSGSSHLHQVVDHFEPGTVIRAPMITLDAACGGAPVDLLRMDAQGSELLVLAGARGMLAGSPDIRICMEWDLIQLEARSDVAAGVREMQAQGFRFWRITQAATLEPLAGNQLLSLPPCDVVACRNDPLRAA